MLSTASPTAGHANKREAQRTSEATEPSTKHSGHSGSHTCRQAKSTAGDVVNQSELTKLGILDTMTTIEKHTEDQNTRTATPAQPEKNRRAKKFFERRPTSQTPGGATYGRRCPYSRRGDENLVRKNQTFRFCRFDRCFYEVELEERPRECCNTPEPWPNWLRSSTCLTIHALLMIAQRKTMLAVFVRCTIKG